MDLEKNINKTIDVMASGTKTVVSVTTSSIMAGFQAGKDKAREIKEENKINKVYQIEEQE